MFKTKKILKIVPDPENYSIILRFLGTTTGSCNMTRVYNSIIYQISRIYKLRQPKLMSKLSELKECLLMQFIQISTLYPHKKLVIVLDSLDQLDPADYSLNWLIEQFPLNIKMIYSCLPTHGDILPKLRKYDIFQNNFVQIKSLDKDLSIMILKDWLKTSQRSISEDQWKFLDELFQTAILYPLYIKILFDIILNWQSSYIPDRSIMSCKNIDACIQYLFKHLETVHGKTLFQRCLIYMSSFKNGISESEVNTSTNSNINLIYQFYLLNFNKRLKIFCQ